MKIYSVHGSDTYVSLTDPASLRQVIAALKAEGMIRRNDRYSSYRLGYREAIDKSIAIEIIHRYGEQDSVRFVLWPVD